MREVNAIQTIFIFTKINIKEELAKFCFLIIEIIISFVSFEAKFMQYFQIHLKYIKCSCSANYIFIYILPVN